MPELVIALIEKKIKETEKEIDSYNISNKIKNELKEKILNCKKQLIKWIDIFGVPENCQINVTAFADLHLVVRGKFRVLAKEHYCEVVFQ